MGEWGGRRAQDLVARCLAAWGTTCHLCGHGQAESADHLLPRATHPELTWVLDNLRPAHHRACPTCGVRCNNARKDRPLTAVSVDGLTFFERHP